ncbi:MAG TPA: hypothetical protein VGO76_21920 [Luteibacter sp.]|jgi:uncharacterized membrane protein|nr:hypothetical protein [Luteibacter sp.]
MFASKSATSFAAAAAILAIGAVSISAPASAADTAKGDANVVHCYGINTCKGTSDCKTAHNDCKGLNSCKGQGFKAVTVDACKAAGGSLTEK